ncbi:YhdP family protein [Dokdonella sp.]|uniref:YhdP family protein n=1 Tax=Dokdonella sp. TaxID=2291710 RepID=UPI003528C83B
MTPFRRRLRKFRFLVQAIFVALVITAAVLVGFAQLALPWLADNPQRIEGWLTERLGRNVTIGKVSSMWTRGGPRLILDDLRIASGPASETELRLPRAELALNLYAAFQRNRAWNEFRLVGLDLSLVRNTDGVWKLFGIDPAARAGRDGSSMGVLGAVVLVDLKVQVVDASRDINLDFQVPELRVVNLGRITRVLGQIGRSTSTMSPLALVADIDVEAGSGRLYAGGQRVDIAELISGLPVGGIKLVSANGDFEFWADWRDARVDEITLKMDLAETVLEAQTEIDTGEQVSVRPRTAFERLALGARLRRLGDDWRLDVADATVTRQGEATPPAHFVIEQETGEPGQFSLLANALDLNALASVAMLAEFAPSGLRRWLYLGNPRGRVSAMDVHWESAGDFSIDMLVEGMSSSAAHAIPGIDSLDARIRGDSQSVMLEIPRQATRIDYPMVFRKPFELVRFGGDVLIWPEGSGWQVKTSLFDFSAMDYTVQLRGGLVFQGDGTKPLIDAAALVSNADVQAAKLFWPVNTMPPPVVEWLDRALVTGTVVEGRAIARGDLDNWPFEDNTGRFDSRAELRGLELAFLPDWPNGENLDVTARFINGGMQASVAKGQSMGVTVDAAEATIARFKDSLLTLSIDASGPGAGLLEYLRATPVGKQRAEYLDGLSIGGSGDAHLQIDVPLNDNERMTLDGRVDLTGSDLAEANWGLRFDQANGRVAFSRTSVLANALQAEYAGFPVMLGIAIGSSTLDTQNTFEASLQGVLPAATVFGRATDLASAMPSFPGEANWLIDLQIGDDAGAAKGRKSLRLQSDLQGIDMLLPAPLDKPAAVAMPFSLNLEMPIAGQEFSARLGDVVRATGRLPGPLNPLSARLDFGPGDPAGTVPPAGLQIDGKVGSLDAGGWISLFSAGGGGGDLLKGVSLDVGNMQIAGRDIPDLHVDLVPQQEDTSIRISGEAMEGEISVPGAELDKRGITAQMSRILWPDLPEEKESGPDALSDVDPKGIPPLHLWVGELQMGETRMGEVRLESFPADTGMRLDLLEARSADFDLRASGDWYGSAGENESHLVIDMSAGSLGSMLDAFGYAGIIEGGETFSRIDATWPGAPTAFALAKTTGTLEISVDKGRILDVDPGAGGRLFGLFSLREIPRRLSLDFSDLFKSGMSFNSINGSFQLRDGSAYTDNLLINSPAADIEISGRTGLREKVYDQEMVVTPRAGVALPLVGALAGGPVGAAAGIVVQTLIGKKINQAARSRYSVEGSWEAPKITLVSREEYEAGKAATATQPGMPVDGTTDSSNEPPAMLARPDPASESTDGDGGSGAQETELESGPAETGLDPVPERPTPDPTGVTGEEPDSGI